MKKILTVVLALALVFAMAAPALAITGDTTTTPTDPKLAPVSVSVELFTGPETLAFNGFNVSAIAANKAYVVNEVAFYGVALAFAADDADGVHDLNLQPGDYEGADLVISCDAFALTNIALADAYEKVGAVIGAYGGATPALNADDELVLDLPAGALWGTGNTVYFFGQGTVAAKGVLKAAVVKTADWTDGLQIYKADGTLRYTVTDAGTSFTVDKGAVGGTDTVTFLVDGDDEVTAIQVNGLEVVFRKLVSGGGSVVAAIGTETSGATFDTNLALYNEVMTFFGFNYDAEGRLLPKHFEAKAASLNVKDEAVVNLYTAEILVPGGVTPPKTGDAASIMGFVMIVLAIVACGVVVSRRVRA